MPRVARYTLLSVEQQKAFILCSCYKCLFSSTKNSSQISRQSAHEGGKVSRTHRPPLPPGHITTNLSRMALGPTQPLVKWVPFYPGSKERPGCDADPSPLLVPWSRKSRAIPLLHIWEVRPVQNLNSCTVQLYLYSPYGPYGLYRASVPVE